MYNLDFTGDIVSRFMDGSLVTFSCLFRACGFQVKAGNKTIIMHREMVVETMTWLYVLH